MLKFQRTAGALVSCLLLASSGLASAQSAFPSRPITLVVPVSVGGSADIMARVLANKLSENLHVPVVVKNPSGASGAIGMSEVARAQADGYTLLYTPNGIAIMPALYHKLSFNPEKDFAPVSQFVSSSLLIAVPPQSKIRTLKDLIDQAKQKPGTLNFGSAGVADPVQLGMEMLKTEANIDLVPVPYKGMGPMMVALMAGEVDVGVVSSQAGLPNIKAGKLHPLAVMGSKRLTALPDVPTVAETVPGYEFSSWHGVFAPVGTPRKIMDTVQQAIAEVGRQPDVLRTVETAGNEVVASTPEVFQAKYTADVAKIKVIVRDAKLPPQD